MAESIDDRWVIPLARLGRGDLALAGGKGANLGELIRGGFPVPDGFVVTTHAYDRFVTLNRLADAIAQTTPESGATARVAFEHGAVPPEVERAILAAWRRLGGGPVAVRSSATAEDLPDATFAGQQDTFLNVVEEAALSDAVRRCWASLWNDRAVAYRARQRVDAEDVKLAVVVQRMVDAEQAGVLFTANPVTGARDEAVIDASAGLGEAVVSGLVTPDHFVLRRRFGRWRVVAACRGRREVVLRPSAAGGTQRAPVDDATRAPLASRTLADLARLGAAIARHFGSPQDVEWAWSGGRLFVVQARPMTALPPARGRLPRAAAAIFAEMTAQRPYPIDVGLWLPGVFDAVAPVFALLGLVARHARAFVVDDGVGLGVSGKLPVVPGWGVVLAPVRVLWAMRRDPTAWRADPDLARAVADARALAARELAVLAVPALVRLLHEARALPARLAGVPRRRYWPRSVAALLLLRLWLAVLRRGDRYPRLMSGVETKTLEANRALEALAAQIRADAALAALFAGEVSWAALEASPHGAALLADVRAFLDAYGHREAILGTVCEPTWADAPEVVLGILKGLATAPPRATPDVEPWSAARDEVAAHWLLRLPFARRAFLALLGTARCVLQVREDTHFYVTLPMPILRRALREIGARLADAGALETGDDVFHLTLEELDALVPRWPPSPAQGAQLRAAVARRKRRRAELARVPMIVLEALDVGDTAGALLRGAAGSPGTASGVVCVVRDGAEFGKLVAGQVLVAPWTNPAWTPLFQRAAAVVVDTGGVGSHAAIVAREYGIPAVMGTGDATRRLADGQRVQVDGTRGLVLAVDAAAPAEVS